MLNMYCRNCGNEVKENSEICVNCGVRPLLEKNFCQECGVETKPNQELCIKCGVRLKTSMAVNEAGAHVKTNFSGMSQYYQEEFQKIYESGESYRGKWNWAAFFFGAIWSLTKGIWLAPLICIVMSIFTYGIVGFIYWWVFGFRGNYMYYNAHAKDKQLPV
jgi:predicted amidophosphoribosyltransferase